MDREYTEKLLGTVRTAATFDAQAVLHDVYSAVIQGDFDALRNAVVDDVELNICGFGPMDGIWRRREDVITATRRNFGLVSGQQPEIESIISQGNCDRREHLEELKSVKRFAIVPTPTGFIATDQPGYEPAM